MAVDFWYRGSWVAQAALIEKRSLPDNPGILAAAATRRPGISADKTGCHLAFSPAPFPTPPFTPPPLLKQSYTLPLLLPVFHSYISTHVLFVLSTSSEIIRIHQTPEYIRELIHFWLLVFIICLYYFKEKLNARAYCWRIGSQIPVRFWFL
jgi:hypothetical protein